MGRGDDLANARGRADIAGIDAQASGTGLGSLDGALIVEMDVRHDRNRAFGDNVFQRMGRGFVRGRDAHDVCTGLGNGLDLRDGRAHIGRVGIGHGLHSDRRIAANRHRPDHDLAGLSALYVAPGPYRIMGHLFGAISRCPH